MKFHIFSEIALNFIPKAPAAPAAPAAAPAAAIADE